MHGGMIDWESEGACVVVVWMIGRVEAQAASPLVSREGRDDEDGESSFDEEEVSW